ncbi:riboflavin kinase [Tritrichomonas musculus]|uniref:riboflavin kinase n=1 Tax=Tritrichomonas musculus TaxID=1915356 RepID=A0ABR2HF90_9EUKA
MNLPRTFEGEIIHGFGRGHKQVGFATANISTEKWDFELKDSDFGVYCGLVYIRGEKARIGVVSVGINYTFNEAKPTFEVHILDFDEDIYGVIMKVELLELIRPMLKFNSLNELIAQITADSQKARELMTPLLDKQK